MEKWNDKNEEGNENSISVQKKNSEELYFILNYQQVNMKEVFGLTRLTSDIRSETPSLTWTSSK